MFTLTVFVPEPLEPLLLLLLELPLVCFGVTVGLGLTFVFEFVVVVLDELGLWPLPDVLELFIL